MFLFGFMDVKVFFLCVKVKFMVVDCWEIVLKKINFNVIFSGN